MSNPHENKRVVGYSSEGAGSVLVEWCPDCGTLKRTMTNWKSTDYAAQKPANPCACDPELAAAVERLRGLAERWEETPEWHDPPFLEGQIQITTGELRDIAILLRRFQNTHEAPG